MLSKLLKDANDIAELKGLNNYVDEIEIEPQRILIPTHNLKI